MARRVFLVGFMGSGKSSFGRRLAAGLRWGFVDTDVEIERRAGMTIPQIFDRHGEEWFRELERQVIEEAAEHKCVCGGENGDRNGDGGKGIVVSLGGGAVCREGVMETLNSTGITVYLKMSPGGLVRRMNERARARRPKIAGMSDDELLDYIEKALPEREKYYNKATFAVDSDAVSDESIVRLLVRQMESEND